LLTEQRGRRPNFTALGGPRQRAPANALARSGADDPFGHVFSSHFEQLICAEFRDRFATNTAKELG
jgi:hypothetical protein